MYLKGMTAGICGRESWALISTMVKSPCGSTRLLSLPQYLTPGHTCAEYCCMQALLRELRPRCVTRCVSELSEEGQLLWGNRTVLCADNSKKHGATLGIFSVRYAAQRLNLPPVNQTHCLLRENKATLSMHC